MSSEVLFTPVAGATGWRINGERLWDSLMALAEIGATPKGGCCRLTLTDLDRQGRDVVIGWAQEAGMSVTVDKIGNVFMRREGRNPLLPPIVSGSHIDTQPTGGKFDGNYGVLAALEVVRTLNDLDIETEAPIEVVFWTNEEGSRFVPVMMGSGVFAGVFPLETIYAAQDAQGKRWARSWRVSAMSAARLPAIIRSAPTLKPISSRDRSWKMKRKSSAWCRGCWGSAGTIAW